MPILTVIAVGLALCALPLAAGAIKAILEHRAAERARPQNDREPRP